MFLQLSFLSPVCLIRPGDIYVFYLKESGTIYKLGKVLRVEANPASKNQVVTFSRVISVIGCGYEEISSLSYTNTDEKPIPNRLERSCARQIKSYAASDLALAISKALENIGSGKQMRLGRAVNMVLAENMKRLERERQGL